MLFSDKIKKLRKTLNVTQQGLAKLLKTTQGTIACWETSVNCAREENLLKLEKLCSKKAIKINWRK